MSSLVTADTRQCLDISSFRITKSPKLATSTVPNYCWSVIKKRSVTSYIRLSCLFGEQKKNRKEKSQWVYVFGFLLLALWLCNWRRLRIWWKTLIIRLSQWKTCFCARADIQYTLKLFPNSLRQCQKDLNVCLSRKTNLPEQTMPYCSGQQVCLIMGWF